MSRTLVTGGAGFIGSHVAENLVNLGHDVTILDAMSTGNMENLEAIQSQIDFIDGDLLEPSAVEKAVAGKDYIFHLAANSSVNRSLENPAWSCRQNVLATVELIKAAVDEGVKRIIFSSSTSVYGYAKDLPVTESHPLQPASPYAQDKVNCENYLRLFTGLYDLDAVALRYFNVYGPRQNPDDPHPGGVTIVINQIRETGSSQVLGDGRQTRDMIYVGDIVAANVAAMNEANRFNGAAFNICTGNSILVTEMHEKISELMGLESVRESVPLPEGNIIDSVGDPSFSTSKLNFTAQVSLEDGLRKTIEWSNAHQ